ncbi:MAG: class I SAM-dependent DNA methyltransferase [Chitinophagaceae bacterium]
MDAEQAYNIWADQYDSNLNKTRDLEAFALQYTLKEIDFKHVLEIGCGTGKNTEWLVRKATQITAVDLSEKMLAKAKEKNDSDEVEFHQADITRQWDFVNKQYDLITFSLVLEHIEYLEEIFRKASIATSAYVYVGELHPFKQYTGTKARFDTENGQQVVQCYNHHVSDFIRSAKNNNFEVVDVNEYFDDDDRSAIPRILTILFKKIEKNL